MANLGYSVILSVANFIIPCHKNIIHDINSNNARKVLSVQLISKNKYFLFAFPEFFDINF